MHCLTNKETDKQKVKHMNSTTTKKKKKEKKYMRGSRQVSRKGTSKALGASGEEGVSKSMNIFYSVLTLTTGKRRRSTVHVKAKRGLSVLDQDSCRYSLLEG